MWNMFKVKNKHQSNIIDVVLLCLLLTLNILRSFSNVFVVFEQLKYSWEDWWTNTENLAAGQSFQLTYRFKLLTANFKLLSRKSL